jgi:putative ABC transport system permease protein
MGTDLRYAFHQLRKSPGFTLAAVVTLALAIGANTAIYQLIDAVMFRPLPVHEPERLVRIDLIENGKPRPFSYPMYRELALRQQVADGLFAVAEYPLRAAVLRGRGGNRTVNAVLVTSSYFDVLGLRAQVGRVLAPEHDQPTAVISDRFWNR